MVVTTQGSLPGVSAKYRHLVQCTGPAQSGSLNQVNLLGPSPVVPQHGPPLEGSLGARHHFHRDISQVITWFSAQGLAGPSFFSKKKLVL